MTNQKSTQAEAVEQFRYNDATRELYQLNDNQDAYEFIYRNAFGDNNEQAAIEAYLNDE